ncbi:MAG: type II secretion system protein [Candidatus Berkelbacteria bacterium]|nr:type II secretion system protein [Candidatus Berkelbacteria bacterium]
MKIFSQKKAFGLIETLVACAILILICGALLTVNLIVTGDIIYAREKAVAYNLAQEAIESGRQIRDSNLIDGLAATNWNTFVCNNDQNPALSSPIISTTADKHYYQIISGRFTSCYGLSERIAMTSDMASSPGQNIKIGGITYNRKIYFFESGVNPAPNDKVEENAIRIMVNIDWDDHGSNHSVNLSELLTNWKRGF